MCTIRYIDMPQMKTAEILLNCKPKKSHTYICKRAEQFDGMKLSKIYNVFYAKLIPIFLYMILERSITFDLH